MFRHSRLTPSRFNFSLVKISLPIFVELNMFEFPLLVFYSS